MTDIVPVLTQAMKDRAARVGGEWKDEGNGYWSLYGSGTLGIGVAYIAVPPGHVAIGQDYSNLDVDVNGGLTYGKDGIFGWDYGHAWNTYDLADDIQNALTFFMNFTLKAEVG